MSTSSSASGAAEGGRSVPNEAGEESGSSVAEEDRARAGEALRASFARLSPQGTDEWNFMGAFTHLGDRYGPYQPGTSELADLMRTKNAGGARRGRRARLLGAGQPASDGEEKSEIEDAMTNVVEAFRFLHARVSTLEARIGTEDVPLDGAAWLAPARELGSWVEPIAALVLEKTPGGDLLHADCGEGDLVRALKKAGAPAYGVEPRGGVALRALESGCDVSISEAGETLAQRSVGSLGGIVLNGVVDRLPLHTLLSLLADCRRVLVPGAPVVIVAEPIGTASNDAPPSSDVVERADLHRETWELLLDRSGFVEIGAISPAPGDDERFCLFATVPTT